MKNNYGRFGTLLPVVLCGALVTTAQQVPETVVTICANPIAANCQWLGEATQLVLTRIDTASARFHQEGNRAKSILAQDSTRSDFREYAEKKDDQAARTGILRQYALVMRLASLSGDSLELFTDSAASKALTIRASARIEAALKKVSQQFEIPGRVKEHESLFKNRLSFGLTALAPAGSSCSADTQQRQIELFRDAYYWKCIAQIEADPTPIANTFCVNRTVQVRERLSALDVWARRKIGKRPWISDSVVVLPHRVFTLRKDPVRKDWRPLRRKIRKRKLTDEEKKKELEAFASKWTGKTTQFAYMEKEVKLLDSKGHSREIVRAIVSKRKYNALLYNSNPRHMVLSRWNAQLALDGGRTSDFIVERVQFKFEDGAFRQVDVWGHLLKQKTPMHFSNSGVPIPYTHDRQRTREHLDRFPLYSVLARNPKNQLHASIDYILSLSNVFSDMPEYQERTENIAPGDTVVTFIFEAGNTASEALSCASLRKEDTRQLFEMKVFTDPIGLVAGKPNGLIQTEVSRRVPLAAPKYYVFNLFRYAEPVLRVQLLNQEERSLLLRDAGGGERRMVRAMDQLNTSTWCVGARLNLLTVSVPRAQSEFEFNALGHLYSTRISDSLRVATTDSTYTYQATVDPDGNPVLDSTLVTREGITRALRDLGTANSFVYGAELRWRMKPDGRYGFELYAGMGHYVLLADPVAYQTDLYRFDRFPSVAFAGIDGWFRPSEESKWFFRARWTADSHKFTNHFAQLQLGYNRKLNFKTK